MPSFIPCLMFVGEQHARAEEAMAFYVALFPNSRIEHLERYGPGDDEPHGTVKQASFVLDGQPFVAMDSHLPHPFTFTPAVSLRVMCGTEAETDRTFAALADGGTVLMPLDRSPFGDRFGWVNDRFGVSWQVTLEP
jgi:predicted 3-demethylubiquinone-9 3-methyltransferase (glyoxalase superfamily)